MSTDSPTSTPVPDPPQPCAPSTPGPDDVIAPATGGPDSVTIHLSWAQAQALLASIQSARRGRDEAAYLVGLGRGDFSQDDIARMRSWHEPQTDVEQQIVEQILTQQQGPGTAGAPGESARLIGLIEWPSEAGMSPDLLFGAGSAQELERMFLARLQQMIATPQGRADRCADELERFVLENGWPPAHAGNEQVLTWLSDLREALISTCCSIWQAPAGRGLAVEVHPERHSGGTAGPVPT